MPSAKVMKKPATVLMPVPTVLVTSCTDPAKPNIVTVAWTGILNSQPPIVYIALGRSRYSKQLITASGEYVINIPSAEQAKLTDYCGMVSGRDTDKFSATGLTAQPATQVKAPLIAECPVNIECKVRQVLSLESHDVFIADVLAVHYNEDVLDEKGHAVLDKIMPIGYCSGEYRAVAAKLGTYGFSQK